MGRQKQARSSTTAARPPWTMGGTAPPLAAASRSVLAMQASAAARTMVRVLAADIARCRSRVGRRQFHGGRRPRRATFSVDAGALRRHKSR